MGVTSLRVNLFIRCYVNMARRSNVSNVQKPVPGFLHLSELCAVSSVLLSERLLVSVTGSGGEKPAGPDSGGLSIMDVEGAYIPSSVSILWPLLAAVQCCDSF